MGLHQTAIGLKSIEDIDWTNKKVLDVGCGDGKLSMGVLKRTRAKELIGIDLSKEKISKAKEIQDSRLEFIVSDASNLPFDNEEFDIIFSNIAFQQFKDKEKSLNEMYRVLKDKGEVIINFIESKSEVLKETIRILEEDFNIKSNKKESKIIRQDFENIAKKSKFKIEYCISKKDTFFFKYQPIFFSGYKDTIKSKIKKLSPEKQERHMKKLKKMFIEKNTEKGIPDTWNIVIAKLIK